MRMSNRGSGARCLGGRLSSEASQGPQAESVSTFVGRPCAGGQAKVEWRASTGAGAGGWRQGDSVTVGPGCFCYSIGNAPRGVEVQAVVFGGRVSLRRWHDVDRRGDNDRSNGGGDSVCDRGMRYCIYVPQWE